MRLLLTALLLSLFSACSDQPGAATERHSAPAPPADPQIATLYNRSCRSCHAGGSGGAPRTGDTAAWEARWAKGADTLLDHTIGGYKGMPPMGMCTDCNESQFRSLIEYMAGRPLP